MHVQHGPTLALREADADSDGYIHYAELLTKYYSTVANGKLLRSTVVYVYELVRFIAWILDSDSVMTSHLSQLFRLLAIHCSGACAALRTMHETVELPRRVLAASSFAPWLSKTGLAGRFEP